MKKITKKEIANHLAEKFGFSFVQCSEFVDMFFDSVIDIAEEGNIVKLPQFGSFKFVNKAERMGRNPKTKEPAIIKARRILRFTPSDILKKQLNSNEQ